MSLLLISQAYSLSEDEHENISGRSENLTKTLQSSENSVKYDNKSKQKKRKLKCFKANKSKSQNGLKNPSSIEKPDLFSQWPFNHFKIVFNFKSEQLKEGWKQENDNFVFYKNINLEEPDTLKGKRNQLQSNPSKEVQKNNKKSKSVEEEDDIFTSSFMDLLDQMENESVRKMEAHGDGTVSKFTSPEESKTTSDMAKFVKPKVLRGKMLSKNQCIMCFKQLNQPSQLERHIRIHTQEKPFSCSICGEGFAQLYHMNVHKNIHAEAKPYQCSVCNKNFKWKRNLKEHEQFHSEEKPYRCLVCKKMFKWQHDLKVHERIHTGKQIYLCQVCNRSFSHRQSLKRHERLHTGERPYQCSICNKSFSYSSNAKRHQQIHDSQAEPKYQCFECGKRFKHSSSLSKHKKSHLKAF